VDERKYRQNESGEFPGCVRRKELESTGVMVRQGFTLAVEFEAPNAGGQELPCRCLMRFEAKRPLGL